MIAHCMKLVFIFALYNNKSKNIQNMLHGVVFGAIVKCTQAHVMCGWWTRLECCRGRPNLSTQVHELYLIAAFFKQSDTVSSEVVFLFYCVTLHICGPGSSVGIVTDYGLDGPGSNPGGDDIFRSSRPAVGPTQPPVKQVPDLSWG